MHAVWKTWLSYLVDIPLEKASTPENPGMVLCISKGQYRLSTENAIYSYGTRYDNFLRFFQRFDWDMLPAGGQVLLLGFGLGSIPLIAEKVFKRRLHYVGVELDPVIAEWARRYTLPSLQSSVQIQTQDALDYVKACTQQFDLIIVDIFTDDKVPQAFCQREFLEDLGKLLRAGGQVLCNRLSLLDEDKLETTRYHENVFKAVFPEAVAIRVGGNQILKSSP